LIRNDIIRVSIIGAGTIATKVHIPCFLRNKYAKVDAIVDIDPKKAESVARKFGIKRFFSSTDKLFNSIKVDAISICTPPDSHAEIAVEALERGINVLCEKPLADNVKNGLKIVEAAEGSDTVLMIGFQRRFYPIYLKVKSIAKEGKIGNIYLTEYFSLHQSPLLAWSKSQWYYQVGTGGSLLDIGPHVLDMLNWFLGRPYSVCAFGGIHSDSPVNEYCVVTVEYDYAVGVGIMSWLSSEKIEKLGIHGTGRTLYASPRFMLDVNPTDVSELSLWRAATSTLVNKVKEASGSHSNAFQLEIDHFVDCIKRGRKPSPNGWDGLIALAATEAATESLSKGVKVYVRNFA